jgi:hypothetical protein
MNATDLSSLTATDIGALLALLTLIVLAIWANLRKPS